MHTNEASELAIESYVYTVAIDVLPVCVSSTHACMCFLPVVVVPINRTLSFLEKERGDIPCKNSQL